MRTIHATDLFCGAGGTSAGVQAACRRMGLGLDLLAINHWDVAIQTHTRNHPEARHICWPIEQISPKRVIPGRRLDLLCASPECTHHSIARGGMPVSDQKRAGAWEICRWATEIRIDNIIVENVREFMGWGPIGQNGQPLKSRKGETFRAWVQAMESLNYRVEWRVLNCADYGDPTSRKRLFILAKRGRGRIEWPKPSHGTPEHPWRTAREIIDWGHKGASIFNRDRPLKPRTLERIAAGLRKFGGAAAEPFLVMLYGTNDTRSVDRPAPTVTAGGGHVGLCEPFILPHLGWSGNNVAQSVDAPMGTVIASHGVGHLVQPFLVKYHGDHDGKTDSSRRTHDVDSPLPTLDCSNRFGLCEPFLVSCNHGSGLGYRTHGVDAPMPTLTTQKGLGVCEPFLVNYNGNGQAHRVSRPLDTITTKDRFGLVEPEGRRLDVLFRMLEPGELAAAQGFPKEYTFFGSKADVVKQIGNAVPTHTASALAEAQVA